MIGCIERGQIDGIIAWKINRLVRNMEEGGKLAQLLIDGKIKEIRTPHQTFRQGDNILPLVLEAATSTQYSLDLQETVVRGMRGHFERGGWNCKAYVGYKNARDPMNRKKGIVVPDHDENRFTILKTAWQMLATGAYTTEHVTKYINETMGFRSRRTAKTGGKPLSKGHAWHVFRNPFYAGYVRLKGELRKGVHEPMISEEQFNEVQAVLKDRSRTVRRPQAHVFTYSGTFRCGYCGLQVIGERHRLRSGLPHISYHCSNSRKACTVRGASESAIEKEIGRLFERVMIDEQICDAAFANIDREIKKRCGKIDEGDLRRGPALAQVNSQIERLSDMWLEGMLEDKEEYLRKRAQLQSKRDALALKSNEWRSQAIVMQANARRCQAFFASARTTFYVSGPERKREIALALCTSYRFFGSERRLEADLHPLLEGIVRFANPRVDALQKTLSIQSALESDKNGSHTGKKLLSKEPVLYGGQDEIKPESSVLDEVIKLLGETTFPDLHLG